MASPEEDEMVPTAPPPAPSKLDLQKIRRLIETAARMSRLPGADFINEMSEQLGFCRDEIAAFNSKTDAVNGEVLSLSRQLETANEEVRKLRAELLERMRAKKDAEPVPEAPAGSFAEPVAPAKKPRKGKVVDLPPQASA